MLLHERILNDFSTATALDIPDVFVANAPMTLKFEDPNQRLTDSALDLPVLTVGHVMQRKLLVRNLDSALNVCAHKRQTFEYLHDSPRE